MQTVLITGAAGGIGTRLRQLLKGAYPNIRLSDVRRPADLSADETFVEADLASMAQVESAVAGVDGIVHVVGFYPRQRRIGVDAALRPDSRYGASKAFGEAVAALYAFKHGLRVTCIRIGNFGDVPVDRRRLSIWIAPQDLLQLIRIGLEHPEIRYETFYGVSDNARGWWDNSAAFRLGYRPQGRSEEHSAAALAAQAKLPPDSVGEWYQGGPFCSEEFSNGVERAPL